MKETKDEKACVKNLHDQKKDLDDVWAELEGWEHFLDDYVNNETLLEKDINPSKVDYDYVCHYMCMKLEKLEEHGRATFAFGGRSEGVPTSEAEVVP